MPDLACACGRNLRIPEAHAGRKVLCPGCGNSLVVPENLSANPSAESAGLPSRRGSPWLFLAIILAVFLVGGVGGYFYLTGKNAGIPDPESSDVSDLSLIPVDGQGFGSVQIAKVWSTPVMRTARMRNPRVDSAIVELGFRPEQIERLSVAIVDVDREIGWGIARTYEPYNPQELLARLQRPTRRSYQEQTYYIGNDPQNRLIAVWFVSPRVVVAALEDNLKRCIDHFTAPAETGPLQPLLKKCDGSHHLIAGFVPDAGWKKTMSEHFIFSPLGLMERGIVTLDLDKQSTLQGRAEAADKEKAEEMAAAIKGKLSFARLLPGALRGMFGEEAAAGMNLMQLLNEVKVTQQEREVILSLTLDAKTVVDGMSLAPNLMRRQ